MLADSDFRRVAEGLIDWAALIPMGKLVCVVGAAGLTGLAAGDQHDGFVPVSQISDEAHGGTVMLGSGTRAVGGAGLRLVGNAQESFQPASAAKRMDHV